MKIWILCAILVLVFSSCDDDDYPYSGIPSVVRNSFWAEFPHAADAKFSRAGENYEVEFESGGTVSGAIIASSGTVLKKKKEISWEAVPAEVRKSLKEQFGTDEVEDPKLIESGGKVYYQIKVERFFNDKVLVLDSKGKKDTSFNFRK